MNRREFAFTSASAAMSLYSSGIIPAVRMEVVKEMCETAFQPQKSVLTIETVVLGSDGSFHYGDSSVDFEESQYYHLFLTNSSRCTKYVSSTMRAILAQAIRCGKVVHHDKWGNVIPIHPSCCHGSRLSLTANRNYEEMVRRYKRLPAPYAGYARHKDGSLRPIEKVQGYLQWVENLLSC